MMCLATNDKTITNPLTKLYRRYDFRSRWIQEQSKSNDINAQRWALMHFMQQCRRKKTMLTVELNILNFW